VKPSNGQIWLQLIGKEDPFNGVDFLVGEFPVFAPNADIEPNCEFHLGS